MDTLTFLQRVLPSDGFYVTTVINNDQPPRQGFFGTVDELAKAITGLDKRGDNTYYAVSTFAQKGKRRQDNVLLTKVLFLDVDCGETKPYPDWKAGLKALATFVQTTGLPKPVVVFSGNGLHVYWVLAEALPPEDWRPLAEGLKAKAKEHDFRVDFAITTDSARILRPIGTHNPKNGNEVKLLINGPDVPVEAMRERLITKTNKASSTPVSKLSQALAVPSTLPAANATVVATRCQQIAWATQHQSEVSEPLWYDLIGVAAYCEDPDQTAISWSEGHPQFDASQTLQKLSRWKAATTGPTTCAKFETDRPGGCKGCKFKDKIGTPARLGIQYQTVAAAQDAPDKTAYEIDIPAPFKRTADGIKMTIDESDIDICKFDIYPVSYGKDETLGYETVRYHWKRPHVGWKELVLRQAYLADGSREFAAALGDQGIVLNSKTQTGYFQYMLRAYMEELRQKRTMTNLYATMGWKENFTQFVIGDKILRRELDGTVTEETITLAAGSQKLGNELYGVAGDASEWSEFTSILERANLPAHMFAVCVSLSSPLYAFTGLKGLTISLYGPTGGGKTLAQLFMQSVWGNPERLHFAAKFTQASLFSRMGLYANMPMTIDEATMMADKDVGDFLYWVSQGRDKARLNRNSEERDAKTFAMPVTVSTNKSMQSKLIASGLDTDAQLARLLEVSVAPNPLFLKDSYAGRKIYGFVNTHYGHAGPELIKYFLALGPDGVKAMLAEAEETFRKKYRCKFSGDERYMEQAIVLADLVGRIATELGLIKFDYTKGIEWVLAQIGSIRRSIAEQKTDSFDILSEYLNEFTDKSVVVMFNGEKAPVVDNSRLPRGSVFIRYELFRKNVGQYFDHGSVMLDRTHFRRWLSGRGGDYKTFTDDLTAESADATPKSKKAYLTKDTPIKTGQSYVIGINLNHPRVQGILDKANDDTDNLAYGKLKLL
jgi:hypothetical protein